MVLTSIYAYRKPYWYDELFTLYLSRLPTINDIWNALSDGLDQNPPVVYLAVKFVWLIFGDNHLSTRLPMLLGYLTMMLCIFRFVSRRLSLPYAAVGMLIPMVTEAYPFAFEARPYGMLLGFSSLSLLFWQSACERNRTGWSLIGITFSLALALGTHCYAALLLPAFLVGEFVRYIQNKRSDMMLWLAFIAAVPVMTLYPYLIDPLGSYVHRPRVQWWDISRFYIELMRPMYFSGFLALLIIIHSLTRQSHDGRNAKLGRWPLKPWETAATLVLALVPVASVVISMTFTGTNYFRYSLLTVIGLSILIPSALSVGTDRHRETGAAIFYCLLILFLVRVSTGQALRPRRPDPITTAIGYVNNVDLQRNSSDLSVTVIERSSLPIVMASGFSFLEADYYWTDELLERTFFLMDLQEATKRTGTNMTTLGLSLAAKRFPLRGQLESYDIFVRDNKKFFLYSSGAMDEWILDRLMQDGAKVRFVRRLDTRRSIFMVNM